MRYGLDVLVGDERWRETVRIAVDRAVTNLDDVPCPAGEMDVVLGPGWPGILLHEAIGHGLEADFNRRGRSTFSNRIGERIASELDLSFRVYASAPWPRGSQRVFESRDDLEESFLQVQRRGVWWELGRRYDLADSKDVILAGRPDSVSYRNCSLCPEKQTGSSGEDRGSARFSRSESVCWTIGFRSSSWAASSASHCSIAKIFSGHAG